MRNCLRTVTLFTATALAATTLPLPAQEAAGQTSLKKVQVNGVQLHYLDQGKGIPVIFVHGGLEITARGNRRWKRSPSDTAPSHTAAGITTRTPEWILEPITQPLLTQTTWRRSSGSSKLAPATSWSFLWRLHGLVPRSGIRSSCALWSSPSPRCCAGFPRWREGRLCSPIS